jgi:hypothetical protein
MIDIPACQGTANEILKYIEQRNRNNEHDGAILAMLLRHCQLHGPTSVLATLPFLPDELMGTLMSIFKGIATWEVSEIEKMRASHPTLAEYSVENMKMLSGTIARSVGTQGAETDLFAVMTWLDEHRS